MPKGYAEGPAIEERLADAEQAERGPSAPERAFRGGVYGSTTDEPESHFLGWADELDTDALFASGDAYGISVRRVRA